MPRRVLVVGLGWVAQQVWLPLLREDDRFHVTGAVDPDPAAQAAGGERYPGLTVWTDVEAADTDVDVAFVATPNATHADVARRLLRRGTSVFVEKPIAVAADQLAAMREAAEGGAAIIVPSVATRMRADVAAIRRLVDDGVVGDVRAVSVSWTRGRGIPRPGTWFTDRAAAGGGALLDIGWHLLDIGLWLLGHPAVASAACVLSYDHLYRPDAGAAWRHDNGPARGLADVEDTARGFLVTAGGVGLAVKAAWASHEPRDVTAIEVDGSRGRAVLTTTFGFSTQRVERPSLVLVRDGRAIELECPEAAPPAEYRRQLDVLHEQLRDRDGWRTGFDEARSVLDAVLRLYAAAGRT